MFATQRSSRQIAAAWGTMMLCLFTIGGANAGDAGQSARPRAREAGVTIGVLPTGSQNAITDVTGVRVGHVTLIEGDDIRTGVTAILPHSGNLFQNKVPAAVAVGNGFGKLLGVTQIDELGVIETPIALTNTLSVYPTASGLVEYTLNQPGNEDVRSVNPVVGECNDGMLNDIRSLPIRSEHVRQAIAAALGPNGDQAERIEEGNVGAGTGTLCMGWKGGIGTASRVVPQAAGGYVVGVMTQTNFNGVLTVGGAPVGQALGRYFLKSQIDAEQTIEHGSCILVVATDAPLDSRQLKRLAKRALLGLAGVGSPMSHGSGDYAIAFSAAEAVRSDYQRKDAVESRPRLRDDRLSPLFLAAKEATEEAVVNSMFKAEAMTGFGGRHVEAIPIDRVVDVVRKANEAINPPE